MDIETIKKILANQIDSISQDIANAMARGDLETYAELEKERINSQSTLNTIRRWSE